MYKYLLGLATLFTLSCGSDGSAEAGIAPASTPDPVVVEKEEPQARQMDVVEKLRTDTVYEEFDDKFHIRLVGRIDTVLNFDDIPMKLFSRFRLQKVEVYKENGFWVIPHPDYEFKLGEMPFDETLNEVVYVEGDSSKFDNINGYSQLYGIRDGELPSTQFARFTFLPKGGDVRSVTPHHYEDLFNVNLKGEGKSANPQAYRTKDGGMIITLRGGGENSEYLAILLFAKNGQLVKRKVETIAEPSES
ncbi:hypothetical protein [Phaeocystidibacter luteus]|uniref:Lipoprotein n=1 Tax=Phaeocystidibacter luteus TaxID=911197 RepID=A0A6N6REV5_9FLAO|nr:hypothetical protein [Phaeocystidibacter luteus]KAB2808604.1 hypothetical protein F8C67_09965 [Phaeocystidibacter luteus]